MSTELRECRKYIALIGINYRCSSRRVSRAPALRSTLWCCATLAVCPPPPRLPFRPQNQSKRSACSSRLRLGRPGPACPAFTVSARSRPACPRRQSPACRPAFRLRPPPSQAAIRIRILIASTSSMSSPSRSRTSEQSVQCTRIRIHRIRSTCCCTLTIIRTHSKLQCCSTVFMYTIIDSYFSLL